MDEIQKDRSFSKYASQGIKGVAIMLMMLHHCFLNPKRWAGFTISFYPFSQDFIVELSLFGKICVPMFVFITAFGLTKSYLNIAKKNNGRLDRYQYSSYSVTRMFRLEWNFWGCFIFWQVFSVINYYLRFTSYGHNYQSTYGTGVNSVIYFFTDALGLAELFGTPSFCGTWWYMSLALMLIFTIPLLYALYKKFGIIIVILAPLLPKYLGIDDSDYMRYLFTVMLGILCADTNLLEKLYDFQVCKNRYVSKGIKFVAALAVLLLLYKLRSYNGKMLAIFIGVMEGVVPVFVIYFCYEFLVFVPVIRNILQLIGKHSMTIFMTHTFIRSYYFKDFTYSKKHFALVAGVLLVTSLLYAILYDNLVRWIGYTKLREIIVKKITQKIEAVAKKQTPISKGE